MSARRDIRQRQGRSRSFEPGVRDADGAVVYAPRPDQLQFGRVQAPAQPVACMTTSDDDDVHLVPGVFATTDPAGFVAAVEGRGDTVERVGADGDLTVFQVTYGDGGDQGPHHAVRESFELVTELTRGRERLGAPEEQNVAPLYGFVSHQTSHPVDDPEKALARPRATGDAGAGVHVVVIDSGVWEHWAWAGRAPRVQPRVVDEHDPLTSDPAGRLGLGLPGAAPGPFLGRVAGHGTFIGGLLRQVVPAAHLTFLRAMSTDGIVDEASFALRVERAMAVQPDVVVICCGGTVIRLGPPDPERKVNRSQVGEWLQPLVLRQALARLLQMDQKPVVVMSAGNDGSSDQCYPAAFADPASPVFAEWKDQLVSVAALDDGSWRAYFSNYGTWVTSSTLGVRLQSTFVAGAEDPEDDPDFHAETWRGRNPWATWSGTSFAAPVVAGMIARTLGALRRNDHDALAVTAWQVLRDQCAPGPDGDSTGVVVSAPMVAHA